MNIIIILLLRWKSNFQEISFEILRKVTSVSQDISVVWSSFQMMGAATEKARLLKFSFVLGIESCCEVDDLSYLGMLGKCPRLAR